MKQLSSHLTHFHEILYRGLLLKTVTKFQAWLKSDTNIMHFTSGPKNFLYCSQLNNTKENLLSHFHYNTFNIFVLICGKSYPSKKAQIPALRRAKIETQHNFTLHKLLILYIIKTHPNKQLQHKSYTKTAHTRALQTQKL